MTDVRTLSDEELEKHLEGLYGDWMYYEAAERGYNHDAAGAARRKHLEARADQELRKSRVLAKPVTGLVDALVGIPKA